MSTAGVAKYGCVWRSSVSWYEPNGYHSSSHSTSNHVPCQEGRLAFCTLLQGLNYVVTTLPWASATPLSAAAQRRLPNSSVRSSNPTHRLRAVICRPLLNVAHPAVPLGSDGLETARLAVLASRSTDLSCCDPLSLVAVDPSPLAASVYYVCTALSSPWL